MTRPSSPMHYPEWRWEPLPTHPSISGGPDRIYDATPKDELPKRYVGFREPDHTEPEPQLWEGDDS